VKLARDLRPTGDGTGPARLLRMAGMSELELALRDALLGEDPLVPASPPLADAVAALDAGDDLRLDHLAQLVAADPAAAAELLSAAAPCSGGAELSLPEAARRTGPAALLRIARDVVRATPPAGPLAALRDAAWRASALTALLCRELARARGVPGEVAYACGLLHRAGAAAALAAFERLADEARPGRPVPLSRWQTLAERWSAPLGLAFAQRRRLPPEITDAIAAFDRRGDPAAPSPSPLVAIVRSVDALVAVLGGADPADALELARVSDREADLLSRALEPARTHLDRLERLAPARVSADASIGRAPPGCASAAAERGGVRPSLRERKGTGVRMRLAGREYTAVGFAAHQLLVSGPAPLWEGALLEVEVLDRAWPAFHARVFAAWSEGDRFGALLLPFGLSAPAVAELGGVFPARATA
jgi:HD-like signal output (HDOD) protein